MKGQFAAVALLVLAGMGGGEAQIYPTKPATVIVPFAPGGPADITGRIVADIFSRHLGQQFVVENVVGADGYTILSGHMGTNAAAPAFYPNLGYDPERDFEPVGLTAEHPELLVVRKDIPVNDLKEFAVYAKVNESKLNMGHAGLGSVSYIGCLLLNSAIRPTMVPFTGTAPVINAMLAGQIDYECDPVLGPLGQVRAGAIKALAIAAKKRSPMLPDVPTVFAPKGTPRPVIDRLAEALNKGLDEEAVQKRLADLGADIPEPSRRGPKALNDLVRSETARLMPILKAVTAAQ
jgi:tripartite-type tricarboxylate transporter receptor subunit TctC